MNNEKLIGYAAVGILALWMIQQFYELLLYGMIAVCAFGIYQQFQSNRRK